jgi:putative ABC transport system permease protein
VIGVGLIVFSISQSRRWTLGLSFALGIVAAFGVLAGLAKALVALLHGRVPKSLPFVWRQGLANLYRPANQTAMVILALGFGAFLLDTVYLVHHNLLRDLRVGGTQDRPNLALFDIQPDQREGMRALMRREGLTADTPVPIVPMRISSLKGRSGRLPTRVASGFRTIALGATRAVSWKRWAR